MIVNSFPETYTFHFSHSTTQLRQDGRYRNHQRVSKSSLHNPTSYIHLLKEKFHIYRAECPLSHNCHRLLLSLSPYLSSCPRLPVISRSEVPCRRPRR